jgi:hypothetical protein
LSLPVISSEGSVMTVWRPVAGVAFIGILGGSRVDGPGGDARTVVSVTMLEPTLI